MLRKGWSAPPVDSMGRVRDGYIRGRQKVPEHAHPLVRRFFELMNREQVIQDEITSRAGLGRQTLRSWHRKSPQLVSFDAALNALGYRLTIKPLSDAAE